MKPRRGIHYFKFGKTMPHGITIALGFAIILVGGCTSRRGGSANQQNIDNFYAMCWRELGVSPPKLERPTPESLPRQLNGLNRYEYRDEISGDSVKGSITIHYPGWDWPSDGSQGSAKQFGDKIVLLGNGDESEMRAFLLRIKGEWHIMQMDFPGGLVKLTKAEPIGTANGSQPTRSETNSTSPAAGSRR